MLELAYEWEGKTKVGEGKGGKEQESLKKNLDFEAILVKFRQKWGGSSPLFPTSLQEHRLYLTRFVMLTQYNERQPIN